MCLCAFCLDRPSWNDLNCVLWAWPPVPCPDTRCYKNAMYVIISFPVPQMNIYLSVYLYVCLPVYLSVISFVLPEWRINVYIRRFYNAPQIPCRLAKMPLLISRSIQRHNLFLLNNFGHLSVIGAMPHLNKLEVWHSKNSSRRQR